MDWVAILLASAVPIALLGGLINRCCVMHESNRGTLLRGRGIGWQFIRFCVLVTGLPIIGVLTLHGSVRGDLAYVFLALAMGYAFGKASE